MTTLSDMLDDLVGSAFSATQKSRGLVNAALVLGVTAAADDDSDMAIAMYASNLLNRGRLQVQNATDPTVKVPTLESLMTPEIQRLITKDDKSTYVSNLIYFVPNSESKNSYNSRSS